jgi:hypothetical protein
MRLAFARDGALLDQMAELIELPLPVVFDIAAWNLGGQELTGARLRAAAELKTLAVARPAELARAPENELPFAVALLEANESRLDQDWLRQIRMVEIADGPRAVWLAQRVKSRHPGLIVALRLPLQRSAVERMIKLTEAGIKVFHLVADLHGSEVGVQRPQHIRDALRQIHGRLVAQGLRDEVTLMVGGGIALAEHVAKSIICGADLVALDTALLVALGCRVCRDAQSTTHAERCPAESQLGDQEYVAQRIVNLMAAWHSQLIEVLGAMGIREVRRLRGEVGRAIFREDIEREAFGDLIRRQA